jgi:DNA-binding MarR family transcriptional regulator
MNMDRIPSSQDHFRSLQILDELAKNDNVTQRDLSSRLGIALGLVNSYVKNLVAKGYITVKAIPPKRYGYYLTPKGIMEKTRLACDLLQDYSLLSQCRRPGFTSSEWLTRSKSEKNSSDSSSNHFMRSRLNHMTASW